MDGANLTVSNVTEEDEGVYVCSAQTALDSVTEETRVTVLGEWPEWPLPLLPSPSVTSASGGGLSPAQILPVRLVPLKSNLLSNTVSSSA